MSADSLPDCMYTMKFAGHPYCVRSVQAKLHEAEADLNEIATQYELQLSSAKQEATELRSRCRKLEAETQFASVFDGYEQEISSLQALNAQLRDENSQLLKMATGLGVQKGKLLFNQRLGFAVTSALTCNSNGFRNE